MKDGMVSCTNSSAPGKSNAGALNRMAGLVGYAGNSRTIQRFMFRPLAKTEEEDEGCTDVALVRALGSIALTFQRSGESFAAQEAGASDARAYEPTFHETAKTVCCLL